jgi:ATP-dependent DNA helicase RecG
MGTAKLASPPRCADAEAPPRALGSGAAQSRSALRATRLRGGPRPSLLNAAVSGLAGVGPRSSEALRALGVESIRELLWHLPYDYRDRSAVRAVSELRIGEPATIEVEVKRIRVRPTRRRNLRIVEARVADSSGPVEALWFNQPWLVEKLPAGTRVRLHGKLERSSFRVDEHELVDGANDGLHTSGLVPFHPASEGLRRQRLREWVWHATKLAPNTIEALPAELRARRRLTDAGAALRAVHFPGSPAEAEAARRRLAFEELLLHQAALASRRGRRRGARPGIALAPAGDLVERWLASLPFELTGDQRRALEEIDGDLEAELPAQRLLMGEVGSGKTVLALYAMLRAVESGHQAALMAPTETLAEQHAATLDRLLAREAVPFTLLTGATTAARRREALARLASGELGLAVGTHALLEPDVEFARLAVCVVDEQHRFGVRQRVALDSKGPGAAAPHVLHMTATPIPRTLSLTAYGDLDATTLRELPRGRRPVRTWAVGEEKREGAYEFIRARLREGRQAFVVCPLVEGSENLEARAAAEEAQRLQEGEFRDFRVALLHGQMRPREKAAAMEAFAAGAADVLVATTVIEVGIDVPNATVMLVEDAERYGLSQLHQLRGRVGRGEHASHCILFADPESEVARLRMQAIAEETDGFKLAEVDLALRGEGEILGTRQHGLPRFRAAVLPDDLSLLTDARREVLAMLERHGTLAAPELGPLLDAARSRFGDERAEPLAA